MGPTRITLRHFRAQTAQLFPYQWFRSSGRDALPPLGRRRGPGGQKKPYFPFDISGETVYSVGAFVDHGEKVNS